MIRRPPRVTRTDTLFPYTTLFRSTLGLAAAVQSQAPDPVEGNDNAPAALEVLLPPQADLSLSIDGPVTLPTRALRAEHSFIPANSSTIAATQPELVSEDKPNNTGTNRVRKWSCRQP